MRVAFFGEDATFHHIGLVVNAIAEANSDIPVYHDPIQQVNVSFIALYDCPIELVEPTEPESPVSRSLQKGNKLLHICFSVSNIDYALSEAERNGFKIIQSPVPAVAFDERRIAWVFSPVWGLFELVEKDVSNR